MNVDLRAAPASATLHMKFLRYRLDVETNSLRAAVRLSNYFRQYLVSPSSPPDIVLQAVRGAPSYDARQMRMWERASAKGRVPKESTYERDGVRFILKNRTGMLIALGERRAAITGDIDRHLNQVVNLIATLFGISMVERGYAMVHAAAVVERDGDGVLIFLGSSGSGKSSVGLKLIEDGGYDFLSNDRVLMRKGKKGVHVVGLPKKPRVNPGTLLASASLRRLLPSKKRPAYEALSPGELWLVEDKHDVDVGRVLGARERLEGWLARAYSLEWKPGGRGFAMEGLDTEGALAAMRVTRKDFGPFDLRREERDMERECRRIALGADFLRVTGNADPKRFACQLVLQAGAEPTGP